MRYPDGEKTLKNLNLPEIKLDAHRLAFKKWLISDRPIKREATLNKPKNEIVLRIRFKEIAMISLIAILTAMNIYSVTAMNSSKNTNAKAGIEIAR